MLYSNIFTLYILFTLSQILHTHFLNILEAKIDIFNYDIFVKINTLYMSYLYFDGLNIEQYI